MGIVIPFKPRAAAGRKKHLQERQDADTSPGDQRQAAEQTLVSALAEGAARAEVLAAAEPLLAICRDRYGFTVMQDGMPRDADSLVDVLIGLLRGLSLLEAECADGRPFPGFGVYFGSSTLSWFDDGCGGDTGLAVPDNFDPREFAEFVRPRLARLRRI